MIAYKIREFGSFATPYASFALLAKLFPLSYIAGGKTKLLQSKLCKQGPLLSQVHIPKLLLYPH